MLRNILNNGTPYSNGATADPARLAWLRWLAQEDRSQQEHYRVLRDYYEGDHNVPLTSRQKEYLERRGIDFRENYLRLPVELLSQRLIVEGFDTDEEEQGGEEGLLMQWWNHSRMDAYQSDTHEAAIADGDTYIIVEWDEEAKMPRFMLERAFDGEEGVKVHYRNQRREVTFASRRWRELNDNGDPVRRLNIYTPDTLYKYYGSGDGSDTDWALMEDPQPWPAGVIPVVHFRHNDNGTSNWGRSELEDLIPDQEMLNKSVLDILEVSDKAAFQLITLSGGLAQTSDGDPMTIDVRSILSHQTGSWGVVPPSDVTPLRKVRDDFIIAIAQKTQIPLQYFQVSGQVASADTQRADDSSLVSRAYKLSKKYGEAWEQAMIIARRIYNASMGRSLAEVPISTVWADFERVDPMGVELTRAQVVNQYVTAGADLSGILSLRALAFTDEEQEALLGTNVLSLIPDEIPPQVVEDDDEVDEGEL